MKINNNIYTDINIFKNEFNLFFGEDWIWSGKTLNELEENNYIVCNLAYNIEVILIKTKNDIKAYLNICPHKNTKLLKHSNEQKLLCQYHKWEFDENGICISAPNCENEIKLSNIKLQKIQVQLFNDFIFLNFQNHSEEHFKSWISQYIVDYPKNKLHLFHKKEYIINSNWKLLVENEMDNYHAKSNHPLLHSITNSDIEYGSDETIIKGGKYQELFYLDNSIKSISSNHKRIDNKDNNLQNVEVQYFIIFPNFSGVYLEDYTYITEIIPIGVDETLMKVYFYSHDDNINPINIDSVLNVWEKTILEDKELCYLHQIGNSNPFAKSKITINSKDKLVKLFLLEYKQKMENI